MIAGVDEGWNMSKKAVVIRGLSYQYQPGGPFALKNISFQAARGEIVMVTGLSGCGKSTLCFCIGGVIDYNRNGVMTGEILLNGKNAGNIRKAAMALEVGVVFQNPDTQLFSPTVEDEIAFGPENLCLPPGRIQERVEQVINLLDIGALREANPCRLSGGEKHLVALAAVLAIDPPVLVLDEVMSQLDQSGKNRVQSVLQRLCKAGKTIIAVEHDLAAVAFSHRVMVMVVGILVRCGNTETLLADRDFMRARKLIGLEHNY